MADEAIVRIVLDDQKGGTQPPLPDYAHTASPNIPAPPPGFQPSMMDLTPAGARNKAAQGLLDSGQANSFDDALSKAKLVSQYVEDYSLAFDNVKQRIVGSMRGQEMKDAIAEVESHRTELEDAHKARSASADYGASSTAIPPSPVQQAAPEPAIETATAPDTVSDAHKARQLLNEERKRKREEAIAAQAQAEVPTPVAEVEPTPQPVVTSPVAQSPQPTPPVQPQAQPTTPRPNASASIAKIVQQPAPAATPTPQTPTAAPVPPQAIPVAAPAPAVTGATPAAGATAAAGGGAAPGAAQALAGLGGTAGNIAAMAAGALPPVAIAMALKEISNQVNAAITGGIKNVIGGAGSLLSGIASADTDPSKPIAAFGEASSKAGEKLNELVPGLGNFFVITGELEKAFAGLMKSIDGTAKRYGEYSPEIAQAQGYAEIQQTMGDLKRSREVGGELAKYLVAQSDLTQKFEDIKIQLLKRILPVVTKILEGIEAILPEGQTIGNSMTLLANGVNPITTALLAIRGQLRDNAQPPPQDPTDQLRFDPNFMNAGEGTRADPGLVPRR